MCFCGENNLDLILFTNERGLSYIWKCVIGSDNRRYNLQLIIKWVAETGIHEIVLNGRWWYCTVCRYFCWCMTNIKTHICVGKLTIIDSDNGLSPRRHEAIIWTNAGILLIGSLGTNFNEILIGIQTFSFKKMHLKMSSAKGRPFCLGVNVLTCPLTLGKFDWGVWYVIIFLYVQF